MNQDLKLKIESTRDFSIAEEFLRKNFSSPTHWPEWNILISKYFHTDFLYYLAFSGIELIGICPMHKVTHGILNSFYSGQFHFLPNGGWIFSKPTIITKEFFPKGISTSLKIYSLPNLRDFNVIYPEELITRKTATLILDLSNTLDMIWEAQFDHKKRTQVRKAEKNNLQIELWDRNNLQRFYRFYSIINTNYNLENLPESFFEEIFTLSKNINFEIFAILQNESLLSTAIMVFDKDYAIFWFAHNDKTQADFGQTAKITWELIKRAKYHGCEYFDLSYIDKKYLPTLYRFKKGFSKKEIPISYIRSEPLSYKIINKISFLAHLRNI